MYDLCLFDLDGTLSDPKLGITKSFQYALAEFGILKELVDLERFIGPPLRESFRDLIGFSEADTEKAVSLFRMYYAEDGFFENSVYPGIPETLQDLKNGGKTLAVATNKAKYYADKVIEHFGLDRFFSFVSGDEMDGSLTKDGKREIIRIALDTLDPERNKHAVMIGDRMHDITGAKENGIDTIGVTWGYGSRAELEEAGAQQIIDTTEGLRRFLLESKRERPTDNH